MSDPIDDPFRNGLKPSSSTSDADNISITLYGTTMWIYLAKNQGLDPNFNMETNQKAKRCKYGRKPDR